jgi:hypothetical protein
MRLVQPMAYPYLFDLKTIMAFFRKKKKNGSLHFDREFNFFPPPFKIYAMVLACFT